MSKKFNFYLILVVVLIGLSFSSCKKDIEIDLTSGIPMADFSFAPEFPKVGQTVTFTNKSEEATSYQWKVSFTGGSEIFTSTDKNLTYVFTKADDYTVDLIAKNGGAISSTYQIFKVSE